MITTNGKTMDLLRSLRDLDDGGLEVAKVNDLAVIYGKLKSLLEDLTGYEEVIKNRLNILKPTKTIYVPSVSKKVAMQEGSNLAIIKTENVYNDLKKIKREKDFFTIVSVVQKKLKENYDEDDIIFKIISDSTTKEKGNSFIKCSKMTKSEILEYSVKN